MPFLPVLAAVTVTLAALAAPPSSSADAAAAASDVRSTRVRLSTGVTLEVAERGAPDGEPVLFLHGYTDSWFSFSTVLDRLPPTIRAIVPTQRGHGDSERPECCYRPADFAADAVALLDALGVPRAGHRTQLAVRPEDDVRAEQWLARHAFEPGTPIYGFHGGASFGPSKLWYPERWAAVADTLHARHGGRTLLFCGPGEEETVRAIAAAAKSPVASAVDDPIDLRLLKAMAKRLALFVGTDAGPRHIAVAFDVPTVALLGSTDPRFSNTNLQHSAVVRTGVECSPCHLKICPIDHRCMTRMSAEMVLAACERVLAGA